MSGETFLYVIQTTETFESWLRELRSRNRLLSHRVIQRLKRLAMGNLGDVKNVGGKVSEARIFSTPALRLYFTVINGVVIVLLCGGDKSDQQGDIEKAKQLAATLFEELQENETQQI